MTSFKDSEGWPHGIISSELDLLESMVAESSNKDFESLHADLSAKGYGQDKADYLYSLKLERSLILGEHVDIEDPVCLDFLNRRADCMRVALLRVRLLLACSKISEAKVHLSFLEKRGLPEVDCSYFRSRICLEDKDEAGWLQASRRVLELDPLRREVIYLIASFELQLSIDLGSVNLLKTYLEAEPLDLVMRSLLRQLLMKNCLDAEVQDQEAILSFLNFKF